ncbi:MAG TPA: CehA/McbA family metallohydrolase [Candidatus Dormibacteraeota bacterium]|nr:CehA/McbA family metallohydrolase [Candidatus Dormibacteraeota bacterium]
MKSPGTADVHMHTNFSDGWPSPVELVDHVLRSTDLNVIAVTDHDTIEGALRARDRAQHRRRKLEVIVGEEVSSRDGHILALFLERRIRPGLTASATVHAIHEQGGLAVAAHPFWRTARQVRPGGKVHGVGWLAAELDFDAIEVENATPGFFVFNQLAHRLNLGLGAPELGSSDAHILDAIGRAFTEFPGRTADELRIAIETGETSPGRCRYRAVGLMRYAAWGFNHQRYAVGAVATAR